MPTILQIAHCQDRVTAAGDVPEIGYQKQYTIGLPLTYSQELFSGVASFVPQRHRQIEPSGAPRRIEFLCECHGPPRCQKLPCKLGNISGDGDVLTNAA